jgi:hypothetical protein
MITKFSFLVSLIFATNIIFAQNCGVTNQWWQQEIANVKTPPANDSRKSVNTSDIHYIPIKIHFVRHTDGSYGKNTSIEPFYTSLMMTNKILSQINIQFYVNADIEYIDNDAYLSCVRGSQDHKDLLAHKDQTTTNVWIVDGWQGSQASGYGGPSGVELADISILTVPHEFGHYLSLAHTFDTGNGIELADGSNCSVAGDLICDTEADPYGLTAGEYNGEPLAHSNCTMTSNTMDTQNNLYHPPFENFMSYYGGFCGFVFTQGQYAKMVDGYNQYHTGYSEMTGFGICDEPTNVTITPNSGYDVISWTNAAGAVGTTVEYSTDGGTSWSVEDGELVSSNTAYISNVVAGTSYKVRIRHLNSLKYSAVTDYTPVNSYPYKPIPHYRDADVLGAIGSVVVGNTSIANTTNANENYSLITYSTTPELIIGGTNSLQLKIKTKADGSAGNTFFCVWIDENRDGDFDDNNELKYTSPNEVLQWVIDTSFTISNDASKGFARMRVRCFHNSSVEDAYGLYSYSETEDYIIKIIPEEIPYGLTATYNTTTNAVDLAWQDNTRAYNYAIERSDDGVNFTTIAMTTSPTPTTFADTTVLPYQQYEYRVRHTNGAKYSDLAIAYTKDVIANYCDPISGNPCGNGYGLTELSIPSISFKNNTEGSCGATSAGYSDYYTTQNINLVAGTTYNFDVQNSGFAGIKYLSIFYDANQDGTFDVNESIFASDGSGDITTGQFTIPVDAINGESRIRFRAYYNPITDACVKASFGETEDYKVTISGGAEASVINANISDITGNSMRLNWQLVSGASSTGITINQSIDGVNFSHLIDLPASDIMYNVTGLSIGTRYYFQIIVNGTINSVGKTVWETTFDNTNISDITPKSFLIYPNPAKNKLVVNNGNKAINRLLIMDITGKIVLNQITNKTNLTINISQLQNGIYFIRIGNSVQKLIKY